MKSIRIHQHGNIDVLQVQSVPEPKITDNNVKVQIKAASMNHLDIWVRNGLPGLPIPLPLTLGSDAAGTVVEVGNNVKHLNINDNVVIQPGTFNNKFNDLKKRKENYSKSYGILGETEDGVQSEYVCLPEKNLHKMSDFLSFTDASSMQLVFMTSYQMLVSRANLLKDEILLVYGGSSGIGSAAIQIAKDIGAFVIATVGDKDKEKHAYEMGADEVLFHYNNDNLFSQIKDISKNNLCDVIFEHVGSKTWQTSLKSLARGGRIVTCGSTTGANVSFDLRYLFMKQQSILGSTMSSIDSFINVMNKIEDKKYKPFVDEVFSFNDVKKAHLYMEESKQKGKIVLVP